MFVEQSVARLWRVRLAFLSLCLFPAVGLGLWGLQRHSTAHRRDLTAAASRLLGVEVACSRVSHPRPGCIQLAGLQVGGRPLGAAEVEATPTEVRLQIDRLACDAAAVPLLAALGRRWLAEPRQFPRNCVIEVANLEWESPAADPPRRLRIECVAAGGGRAVRLVTAGQATNEIRIVHTPQPADPAGDRWEVLATLAEPLPAAIVVAAAAPSPLSDWRLGGAATVAGTVRAVAVGGDWAGEATGRLEAIDLAAATKPLAQRAEGLASLDLASLLWAANRLTAAEVVLTSPRGRLASQWLDGMVGLIGCRGATADIRPAEAMVEYERLGLRLECDRSGARIRAEPQRAGCLVESQGLPLLYQPRAAVTLDRLAWLFSGTRPAAVPGTPVSAWMLSVLPLPQASR